MREEILAVVGRYLPGPFKPTGPSNYTTRCPFHKGGEERRPSFSIDVDRGIFHCFTCHEAGSIRTLLKLLQVPATTIDAELQIVSKQLEQQRQIWKIEKENTFVHADPFRADYVLPEAILGVFELMPLRLVQWDGFSPALLQRMEIGYDRVNHRITYPLRDVYGNLAGFSGGITDLTTQYRDQKYRIYEGRRRLANRRIVPSDFGGWFDEQFPDYRISNHDFLWNYEQVYPRILSSSDPSAMVILVEGFKACLWTIQSGFPETSALMGSSISERQQQLLHRLGCTVVLFLDNDEAGRRATERIGDMLWRPMHGHVEVVPYPEEDEQTQPDDYEADAVRQMLSRRKPYTEYLNSRRRGYRW